MVVNRNSSITRVRPFFQRLLAQDPSGSTWLPVLLSAAHADQALPRAMVHDPGQLLAGVSAVRPVKDRTLIRHGGGTVMLEGCFERKVPPSESFLRWLIENPSQMSWPLRSGREERYKPETQQLREELMGRHGEMAAQTARMAALPALRERGVERSGKKWWAFEGFTHTDCYLETDRLLLIVEGKRNETITASTSWFPARNQIARNLEVAGEVAGDREFAVLVMTERPTDVPDGVLDAALPHMSTAERDALKRRMLGPLTWSLAGSAVGLSVDEFPDTTDEAVERLNAGQHFA